MLKRVSRIGGAFRGSTDQRRERQIVIASGTVANHLKLVVRRQTPGEGASARGGSKWRAG